MRTSMSLCRAVGGAIVAASFGLLVGCGGGGDGGGAGSPSVVAPPAAAATINASPGEATSAAQAVVESAARAAELSTSLGQGPLPLLAAGNAAPAAAGLMRAQGASLREQALARQTLGCFEFVGLAGCTGSVTLDTDLSDLATQTAPGNYIGVSFNALRATEGGLALALDGTVRIDFLTALDLGAPALANQRFTLTLSDFRGTVAGIAFGPLDALAMVEFDAASNSTLTMDGMRLQRIENVDVTNASNFNLGSFTLRRAGWSQADRYIDYEFSRWTVAGARPTLGSSATVRGASGHSIAVVVTASSPTQVVYDVRIALGGTTTRYTVTATYPADGGAPAYTAVGVAN